MTATLEARTLHHVAPGDLLLERNIREAAPSPDLVASIKDLGVLVPITAVTNYDGDLVVRSGHRRTLAALEAGLEQVPVYVLGDEGNDDASEVTRIISQRDENTQRADLTTADEIAVVEQLAAFGLSADQMMQQARLSKETVDTALAISGSKLARKTAAKYEALTLDQVAAVAEFENDPEVAKNLVVTAIERPEAFDHYAQRVRDDRDRAQLLVDTRDQLAVAGVKVLTERPGQSDKAQRVDYLVNATTGKDVTEKGHAKCPGHAVLVTASLWGDGIDRIAYCMDPKANGHRDRYSSTRTPAAELPEKEREAAKQARALVIENNKAWASAQTVRRQWLANFAKVKTAPKGTAAFIAAALAHDLGQLTIDYKNDHRKLLDDWLREVARDPGKAAGAATEARALVIVLVQLLARYEGCLSKDDWRSDGSSSRPGRYLQFLGACGYDLSDVELYAISKKTV